MAEMNTKEGSLFHPCAPKRRCVDGLSMPSYFPGTAQLKDTSCKRVDIDFLPRLITPPAANSSDPYVRHFEESVPENIRDLVRTAPSDSQTVNIEHICTCTLLFNAHRIRSNLAASPLLQYLDEPDLFYMDLKLKQNLSAAMECVSSPTNASLDLRCVSKLAHCLGGYADFYFPLRSISNSEQIRVAYCLHLLNHTLRERESILANNGVLRASKDKSGQCEVRDQGLTRPTVLIVVPFKDCAYRIVRVLSTLLFSGAKRNVSNWKRFRDDFGPPPATSSKRHVYAPPDYEATFAGNVDDCFKIGLGVSRHSLKLYTDFYRSDIIIASPLGLKVIIDADNEVESDFDFFSSIEVCVFDQADVFLMQNWAHVLRLLECINKRPKKMHDADISRVRMWALDDLSQFYRQTILFSAIATPELKSVFTLHAANWSGRLMANGFAALPASITAVSTKVRHIFQRFACGSLVEEQQMRMEYFKQNIFSSLSAGYMTHILVYVSSYFDFVCLRNFFKKEIFSFVQVCEYTKENKVSRARDLFYHGTKPLLLFTERYHFYHRYKLRGISHLIFYQPPIYPHYYSELCNMIEAGADGEANTCTILFSSLDAQRIAGIVGREKASMLISSTQPKHIFTDTSLRC